MARSKALDPLFPAVPPPPRGAKFLGTCAGEDAVSLKAVIAIFGSQFLTDFWGKYGPCEKMAHQKQVCPRHGSTTRNPPRVISDSKCTNSDPKLSQIAKSNYFIRPLYELPEKPSSASRPENVHCKYRRLHRTKRLILVSKDL